MDINRIDEVRDLIRLIDVTREKLSGWESEQYRGRVVSLFSSIDEFEQMKKERVGYFKQALSELEEKIKEL